MKFKLDENLGKQIAEVLQNAGYDTATVPGQGLCGTSDKNLINICHTEERCLITLDTGFSTNLFKGSGTERYQG